MTCTGMWRESSTKIQRGSQGKGNLFLTFGKEHIRQDVGVFLVGVLHYMGIDVGGDGNLGITQPLGDADAVRVHGGVVF